MQLHKYTIMRVHMKPGLPLTFSDGERVVSVLSSAPVIGYTDGTMELTVLVELPDESR